MTNMLKLVNKLGDLACDILAEPKSDKKKSHTDNEPKHNAGHDNSTNLPLPIPVHPGEGLWCCKGKGRTGCASIVHVPDAKGSTCEAMRIDYIAGEVGMKSGFGLYSCNPDFFPCKDCTFSFSVYIPENYDWKKGGKLPGLYIGEPGSTGGDWATDSGSARVIFKPHAVAAAYLYIPTQVADGVKDRVPEVEGPEYQAIANVTSKMGHQIWYKDGKVKYNEGAWNTVSLRVKLNTPGESNGVVELTVNGQKQKFNKMIWRTDKKVLIGGLNLNTFFGGNDDGARAPPGAYKIFKDFAVETKK